MFPIIFLDIDGVLNCELFYKETPLEKRKGSYPISDICPNRILLLNDLCEETNAKVVISSTWRLGRTTEQLQSLFNEAGATFEIIDVTPHYYYNGSVRGNEIKAWIEENSYKILDTPSYQFKKYAIIDDDSDMLIEQIENFFQTNNYSGLTPLICLKIKNFLKKDN